MVELSRSLKFRLGDGYFTKTTTFFLSHIFLFSLKKPLRSACYESIELLTYTHLRTFSEIVTIQNVPQQPKTTGST